MGEKVVKEWCHLDLGVWKSKLLKYKPKWLPWERHTAKSKSKLKQTKEVSPKVGFNLWAIPSVCSVACHAQCLPQSGQFDLQDKSWIQNSSRLHWHKKLDWLQRKGQCVWFEKYRFVNPGRSLHCSTTVNKDCKDCNFLALANQPTDQMQSQCQ